MRLVVLLPALALGCSERAASESVPIQSEPAPAALASSAEAPPPNAPPAPDVASNGHRAEPPAALPEILATDALGKRILYLRGGDLYLAKSDRSAETLLVRGDGKGSLDGDGDLPLRDFYNIEFHPDGKRALFSVENGRGEAIGAVDLQTKKIAWLASAFGHEHVVIPRGPNKGHLLLYKHRYNPGPEGGSYDVCILANGWTGEEIRDVTLIDRECWASPEMKRALRF